MSVKMKQQLKQIIKSVILETAVWENPTEADYKKLAELLGLDADQLKDDARIHNLAGLINVGLEIRNQDKSKEPVTMSVRDIRDYLQAKSKSTESPSKPN